MDGSGRAVVGWSGGTPPLVYAGGLRNRLSSSPSRSSGLTVMAATGRLPGRVADPVRVSLAGADVDSGPKVAVGGVGVAYVAWPQTQRYVWMVSTARGTHFSTPRPLGIPAGAQLQALASPGGGPVAAVWLRYHVHSAPALRYALLGQTGTVGRVVTIAQLGSPLQSVQFAINDAGAVVASWANTGRPFGNRVRVSAERCSPAGRCAARQTVSFARPAGQDVSIATTLSDAGTAAIVISSYDQETAPRQAVRSRGLEAAVSRTGGPFRSTPLISATGRNEAASAQGRNSAIAVFNVGGIPIRTLAWSRLRPSGAFTAPQILDRNEIGTPVIAGAPAGDVTLAWTDAPLGNLTATSTSIHATTGNGGTLARPQTIAPGRDRIAEATLATGIDHHGNAIVIWDSSATSGTHGVFAATYAH